MTRFETRTGDGSRIALAERARIESYLTGILRITPAQADTLLWIAAGRGGNDVSGPVLVNRGLLTRSPLAIYTLTDTARSFLLSHGAGDWMISMRNERAASIMDAVRRDLNAARQHTRDALALAETGTTLSDDAAKLLADLDVLHARWGF